MKAELMDLLLPCIANIGAILQYRLSRGSMLALGTKVEQTHKIAEKVELQCKFASFIRRSVLTLHAGTATRRVKNCTGRRTSVLAREETDLMHPLPPMWL